MAQNKNTFIKGMDQDTSKQKYSQDKYIRSRNFRPITDEGLSSGAMENIQGTQEQHKFPEIKGFLELDFNASAYDVIKNDQGLQIPQTGKIHLRFSTPGSSSPYPSKTLLNETIDFTSPKDYLDQIIAIIENINASLPIAARIEIYRKDTYDRIILRGPIYSLINIEDDGFMTSLTRPTMKDFIVIGSTHLRDKNIIFTISQPDWPNTVLAEGGQAPGQVWQMVYDPEYPDQAKELKLLYYGDLRFSLNHPIEAVAHYENDETQIVYWTDNYNPPRKLNIVDADAFILREDDLLLNNKATLMAALPSTEEQEGGSLPTGLFYLTYKLQKFGGSITGIAPWSSAVPINSDDISPPGNDTNYEYTNYAASTVGSTKILNYVIPELPQGFDKIYVYAVYEKSPKEYFVYIIEETLLDDSSFFNIRLSSVGDKKKLNISQLQEFDIDFETVKSLTIKDSQMLFGNVKLAAFDLDWDARAYRFKKGTSNSYVPVPAFNTKQWGISLTDNIINPHNDDRTAEIDDYRYQRDKDILGGNGPNIAYSFTWKDMVLDQSSRSVPSNDDYNIGEGTGLWPDKTPFINCPTQGTIDVNAGGRSDFQTEIDAGPGFENFKNNRYEAYFKGYQRDEVYRFGIVFYSHTGKPSEVKWIGDIRFPCDGDLPQEARLCRYHGYNNYSPGDGIFDVPKVSKAGNRQASIGASLGIKFNVDVSDIASKISGYSIVRAPRYERDRTIVAQGAYGEVRKDLFYVPRTGDEDLVYYNHTRVRDTDSDVFGTESWKYGTIDCPDLKFPSGARIFDYIGLRDELENNYYVKPVAGYVNITEAEVNADPYATNSVDTPTIVGSPWSPSSPEFMYTKSLLRISQTNWSQRLGFVKEDSSISTSGLNAKGKLDAIIKVGANAAVTIGGDTFSNRGFITTKIDYPEVDDFNDPNAATTVTGKKTLVSPGCQTVLFRGVDDDIGKFLLNSTFGYNGQNIADLPYQDNNIGDFGYNATQYKRLGHTAIVDIYRLPNNQYGGNTYEARQNTKYITTGHFAPVFASDTEVESTVFGGDIYIAAYPEKKLYGQVPRDATVTVEDATGNEIPQRVGGAYMGPIMGRIYPIATIINTDMRIGFHFNNYIQGAGGDIDLREEAQDDYLIPSMYHREKDLQTYFVEGAGNNLVGTFDNRVYISNPKINGERADSWSVVKPLSKYDVDGLYGPINKLMTLNELVVFFQDRAFGKLSVNPTAMIPSMGNNTSIQLGTGKGIQDAIYVSNTIGCFHQWAITKSRTSIYWFDAVHKKLIRFNGQGPEVISDKKSMSSWFHNKVRGSVIVKDNPILYNGIACTYDFKHNEIIFTFHTDTRVPDGIYSLSDFPGGYMQEQLQQAIDFNNYVANNPNIKGPEEIGGSGSSGDTENGATGPISDTDISTDTLSGSTTPVGDNAATNEDNQLSGIPTSGESSESSNEDSGLINDTSNSSDTGVPPVDKDDCFLIQNKNDRLYGEDLCGRPVYTGYMDYCQQKGVLITDSTECSNAGGYWSEDSQLCYINAADASNPLIDCFDDLLSDPTQINPTRVEPIYPTEIAFYPPAENRWYDTIVFNENIDQFSSFYDHFPTHYINDGRKFFSQNPKGDLSIHIHEEGERTVFYGNYFPASMLLVVNPKGDHTKVFTNVEMFTIVSDTVNFEDKFNQTFSEINYFNEYQGTGFITLTPEENIKRRMRTWRTAIPRDADGSNARIRNPYMEMYIAYDRLDNEDKRIVVHDITTHYMDVPM